jgi:DNA polymerase-3 subunit gamma/tau
MQALYRKYRSKALKEVVGQEHITETLTHALEKGRISHAYLFTGPRGVGKTSVARILAHEINKLPYDDTSHLDIIEIDAASNRRIDDIRDLRDKVHIAPSSATYKVYIIDEVHMLTTESFNALLKTLEEPPEHVVFILATTEAAKLPATIISRVQRYNFRPVAQNKVVAHLRYIAEQENIAIDDEALMLVADHGEGSFRDSISLLDQLANTTDGLITAAVVEQSLGLAPQALLQQLIAALEQRNGAAVIAALNQLANQGVNSATLLPQLLRVLQQAAISDSSFFTLIDKLLEVPRAYNPDIKLLTVLLGFLPQPAPQAISPSNTVIKPKVEALASKPEPSVVVEEKPVEMAVQTPQETPAKPLARSFDAAQWEVVVSHVKQASPPLASMLRSCDPMYDESANQLTLQFRYTLHRKRIEEVKSKAIICKAFAEVMGTAPVLATELHEAPQATPGRPEETMSITLDTTAQSVADIMGGGVPVQQGIEA